MENEMIAGGENPAPDAWQQAVQAALKGRPFESLFHVSEDGDRFPPLAGPVSDSPLIPGRSADQAWQVSQKVFGCDRPTARTQMLDDLNGGAGALDLVLSDHPLFPGRGPARLAQADYETLFEPVMLDLIGLRLSGGAATRDSLETFYGFASASSFATKDLAIGGCLDPAATAFAARRAKSAAPEQEAALLLTERYATEFSRARPLLSDGRIWHGYGARAAQELALVLAGFVDMVRCADGLGFDVARVCRWFEFALAADTDQLETIAKFRAIRPLTAQVLEALGAGDTQVPIHAETAWRMMTLYEQNVGMLRATVSAFAAAVGGADTITVLPHSLAAGIPNAMALRIARNTQTMLAEESNLHRVADPARGAGAIEARTKALMERAWELFQSIEAEGGLARMLPQGRVETWLLDAQADRERRVAIRDLLVTGTTSFPSRKEAEPDVVDAGPAAQPQPFERSTPAPRRLSESFEMLRAAANRRAEGAPDILLLPIGPPAGHSARLTWIRAVFEIGGLSVADAAEPANEDGAAEAFRASGAAIACLCGADGDYAEEAGAVIKALMDAGAAAICIAGKPDRISGSEAWAAQVIGVHDGLDILGVLQDLHKRLKI
ncbi:MAG: methylmalonyl-CoA mutase family protein [Pseudomonadota bacterium]